MAGAGGRHAYHPIGVIVAVAAAAVILVGLAAGAVVNLGRADEPGPGEATAPTAEPVQESDTAKSVDPSDVTPDPLDDPCRAPVSNPDGGAEPDTVEVDLDGDGRDDLLWLEDGAAAAVLADGRTIATPLEREFSVASLVARPDGSGGPLIVDLDDEPGQEVLVGVQLNNWWGVAPLDLEECRLSLVPTQTNTELGNEIAVLPLALGTGSPSCFGACLFSLTCPADGGLRHTEARPVDGTQLHDQNGNFNPDAVMTWATTNWEMIDGRLVAGDQREAVIEGTAPATEIGDRPELTNGIDC